LKKLFLPYMDSLANNMGWGIEIGVKKVNSQLNESLLFILLIPHR